MATTQKEALEKLREALSRMSAEYWAEYVSSAETRALDEKADISPGDDHRGAYVVLSEVDFAKQAKVGNRPCVFTKDAREQIWCVLVDRRFNAMLNLVQDVQLDFGWPATEVHDVVGTIDRVGWAIFWDYDIPSQYVPVLQMQAMRVPEQFAVFFHPSDGPRVPGLASAQTHLEAFREKAEEDVPTVINEPKDILAPLLKSLEVSDFDLFTSLMIKSRRAMAERRFLQFRKSFDQSDGDIHFSHYDDRFNPDNYDKLGQVKVFVERNNTDGTSKTAPLVVVREDGEWRIKSGLI